QQFAALTMRHGLPAAATTRDFADAGLLMAYGASNVDADRQGGILVGRVLKGDKPVDLPVQQSVKVELIINLIAAKALGLAIPRPLRARADEVIEQKDQRGRLEMKLPRRQFLDLAAGAAALPVLSRIVQAQAYPSQPVRIVVGFAAGGGNDIVARLMGQWLSERLGQSFIIENRPGAGGSIATGTDVRAPADGYTLLFVTSTYARNTTLYDKLNFIFHRDIAAVASIMSVPNVVAVTPSLPVKTMPEFMTYARANPGKLNMGSGGIGA